MEKYDYLPAAIRECNELKVIVNYPSESLWENMSFDLPSPLEEHARMIEQHCFCIAHCPKILSSVDQHVCEQTDMQRKGHLMNKKMLRPYFRRPLDETAIEFGISSTSFKSKCREIGIKKWPSRKLNSLDRLYHCLHNDLLTKKMNRAKVESLLTSLLWITAKIKLYEKDGYVKETAEDVKKLELIRYTYRGSFKK